MMQILTEYNNTKSGIFKKLELLKMPITPHLNKDIRMLIKKDLISKNLPPNFNISQKNILLKYFSKIVSRGLFTGSSSSFLDSYAWTSTGGSFKLANENNYQISKIINKIIKTNNKAIFLEIGAGYAGLNKYDYPNCYSVDGIGKLIRENSNFLGNSLEIHFTNIAKWHNSLPNGVYEHPHFLASTIELLIYEGIKYASVDIIYSQCAAFFDSNIISFIKQSEVLLKYSEYGGYLIFNLKTENCNLFLDFITNANFKLIDRIKLNQMNGSLLVLKKKNV